MKTANVSYKDIEQVVKSVVAAGAHKATKYVSDKFVVRATRKAYGREFSGGKLEILLTIGTPNYREKEFIKACKKAKEPFPIKKVQLKFLAKK